jgi:hypothetical protein
VVGATDSAAVAAVRAQAPRTWLLCPGVGAQGGDLALCCAAGLVVATPGGSPRRATGLLFPVSRGLSAAADPAAAAYDLRARINAARATAETKAAAAAAAVAAAAAAAAAVAEGGEASAKRRKGSSEPEANAAAAASAALAPYQQEFIAFALSNEILKFGSFTLKSGRTSPYFFNAGEVCTGGAVSKLASFYAQALVQAANAPKFDVLFGPAYKGIPLATAVGMALFNLGVDVGVCYNRKEAKDHGEGGLLVGAPLKVVDTCLSSF